MNEISVVLTHYNTPTFLGECLKSILSQTYGDIDIYLIDDCSPNRDWLEMNHDLLKDKRIHCFSTSKNVGTYQAKNKILTRIQSPYVVFHDSDDVSLPNRFAVQLKAIKKTKAGLVGCSFFEGKSPKQLESSSRQDITLRKMLSNPIWGYLLGKRWLSLHPTWLLELSLIKKVNYFCGKYRVSADDLFLYHSFHHSKVINLQETLYFKRCHSGSLTAASATGMNSALREKIIERIELFRNGRFKRFLRLDKPRNGTLFKDDFQLFPIAV